jgi:hypothetical protein
MCEPRQSTVTDAVGSAIDTMAGVAAWGARTTVRLVCRRLDDDQVERARWVLCWRFVLEAVFAAAMVWWLGVWSIAVFLGIAAVSWTVGHALAIELQRRSELPEPVPEPVAGERPRLEVVA